MRTDEIKIHHQALRHHMMQDQIIVSRFSHISMFDQDISLLPVEDRFVREKAVK